MKKPKKNEKRMHRKRKMKAVRRGQRRVKTLEKQAAQLARQVARLENMKGHLVKEIERTWEENQASQALSETPEIADAPVVDEEPTESAGAEAMSESSEEVTSAKVPDEQEKPEPS